MTHILYTTLYLLILLTTQWHKSYSHLMIFSVNVAQRWRICLRCKRRGLDPWVGKIPWKKKWRPMPVFLLGESNGQRSVVGYCPQDHKGGRHDWVIKQQTDEWTVLEKVRNFPKVIQLVNHRGKIQPCLLSTPKPILFCYAASIFYIS